jgi:hypothetical protein
MSLFYFLLFLTVALLATQLIRTISFSRRNQPINMFFEGLKKENEGRFEEAALSYETALIKFSKIKPYDKLIKRISVKQCMLKAVMEGQQKLPMIRVVGRRRKGHGRKMSYDTTYSRMFFRNCLTTYNFN